MGNAIKLPARGRFDILMAPSNNENVNRTHILGTSHDLVVDITMMTFDDMPFIAYLGHHK
jgi:hypothetical protein